MDEIEKNALAEEEKRRKDMEERAKALTIDGTGKSAKPRVAAVFIVYLKMDGFHKGLAFVDDTNCIYGVSVIEGHISSDLNWCKQDMWRMSKLQRYHDEFPDGYTVVEIEEPFFGGFTKSSVTTVEGRKKLDELWDEIYSALASKRQEHLKEKVYRKYRIVDAMTGKEKKGIYFILKVDAKDETERKCVRAALASYADSQRAAGRADFADSIEKLIQRG